MHVLQDSVALTSRLTCKRRAANLLLAALKNVMKKIYVTSPEMPELSEYVKGLEEIWKTKHLTNNGRYSNELECGISEYLGIGKIALYSNGTIPLIAALRMLEVKGEVITTPFSFVATSSALALCGLKPVYVDIDPNSYNISVERIERNITENTSAILATHCYGYPCDVERIEAIANKYNLKVIYDAAHAFGVRHKNKSILEYGDVSTLSFHATKVFSSVEGGALYSKDQSLIDYAKKYRNFGITSETDVDIVGENSKMSEFHALFGLLQLKDNARQILKRKEIYSLYCKELEENPSVKILSPHEGHNYSYVPIRMIVGGEALRDRLVDKLNRAGYYPRKYFYPLIPKFSPYKKYQIGIGGIGVAETVSSEILCLPIYPSLELDEVNNIIQIIKAVLA